jgi:hypothetical protein
MTEAGGSAKNGEAAISSKSPAPGMSDDAYGSAKPPHQSPLGVSWSKATRNGRLLRES